MPREPRIAPKNSTFHIMNRGNNKHSVFRRECEYNYFKKLLLRYKKKYHFLLHHYSLMKNHFHLALSSTEKTDLSKLMHGLQLSYTHYQKKRRKHVGYLWQGRFTSRIIKDDKYLLTTGFYIERNPVAAGLTALPEQYEWSSYKHYAFGEKDPLIDTNPLYFDLGATEEERQMIYRQIMAATILEAKKKKCTDNDCNLLDLNEL